MIKKIFHCVSILLTLYACNPTNVTITGKIKGANKQKVYLEQQNVNRTITIDSTQINSKGEFKFKTTVNDPTFFNVRLDSNELVTIIAEPDVDLILNGTLEGFSQNYWVEGSDHALWVKLLNFQLNQTQKTIDSLQKKFHALPQEITRIPERLQIVTAWDSVIKKQKDFSRDFILKHAVSLAAYYALYQKFDNNTFILQPEEDFQSFKTVASSLKAMYPESQYTKAILNHINQIIKNKQNEQIRQLIANSENTLPEIKLPNTIGDTIRLSSLKGKYIVLDFSVLNAQGCKNYIDQLKKIQQRYKNKGVRIFQVCLDQDPTIWKNLVKKYGIDWICVNDPKGYFAKHWNIQDIPANYIINPSFEIVGKNLQGQRLEERLNDLLK